VFRLTAGSAEEVLPPGGRPLAVDAAPLVNDRSLVVSGGRIYFRAREASGARYVVRSMRDSLPPPPPPGPGGLALPELSADGRFLLFATYHYGGPRLYDTRTESLFLLPVTIPPPWRFFGRTGSFISPRHGSPPFAVDLEVFDRESGSRTVFD